MSAAAFTLDAWHERSRLPLGLLAAFAADLVAAGLALELEAGRFALTHRGRALVEALAALDDGGEEEGA